MPREKRISTRLDTLLDSIFEPHPDPFSLYWEIAAEMRPELHAPSQQRVRRLLQRRKSLTTDSALLAACVFHLTGFPTGRILDFLSRRVTAAVTIPQFELAVAAIFIGDPPVPPDLLYDLTQYTYLEKRLLVQKGLEISAKLGDVRSPEVLLYLYLLSLRGDLSNENVQLIVLIMKNCFPNVEVPTRFDAEKARQYGEVERAWKSAQQRPRFDVTASAARGDEAPDFERDSASALLDKYYADEEARSSGRDGARKPAARASRSRRSEPPPPPAPQRTAAPGAPRRQSPRKTAARKSSSRARTVRAAAPSAARSPAAQAPVSAPAAPGPVPPAVPAKKPGRSWGGGGRLPFLWLPFVLGALAVCALSLLVLQSPSAPGRDTRAPSLPQNSAQASPAGTPQAGAAPQQASTAPRSPAPAARAYVVRPGDSLWKIFHSIGPEERGGANWRDFLSGMQSANGLADPDLIRPGSVLSITPQDK
jgi:hypothetical protein